MTSELQPQVLNIEGLTFELRRTNRKSLRVTVDRDGSLRLTAPRDATQSEIEETVRKKLLWIHKKLAEKRLLDTEPQEKRFVSGEGFCYLGRSYRLLLVEDEDVSSLRLTEGRFKLRRDALPQATSHFVGWYTAHAQSWLWHRVGLYSERLAAKPKSLNVRDLGYRWGSCGAEGNLNFNWRVICLPPRIVEYIIAHELVHLEEPNHGKDFWNRLRLLMPDYELRKESLARNSVRYVPTLPSI